MGVGDAAEQLGGPERCALGRHCHVAEHGDHHPAALADPVHRAHDRLRRSADGVERHHVHAEQVQHAPVVWAATAELTAGDEHVSGSGDEQTGQVRLAVHVVDGVADAEVHGRREGVARLGPVDREVGEHTVALEAQELRPEPVALGRAGGISHLGHHW